MELINPVADTVANATFRGADVDWYIKADDLVLKGKAATSTSNVSKSTPDSLKNSLFDILEQFNPNAPLEILFDYVRIRFLITNPKPIIEDILKLKMEYMLHEDYAFYSYMEQYVFGDIVVMVSPDEDKGCLLELKGKGCRQFENFLLAQQRTWFDFFMGVFRVGRVFKRIDLAINDKTGILDIPFLTEKCRHEECISVFRSFKSYRSGELVQRMSIEFKQKD
ncbi:hypothetical protein J8TS2_42330 [Lederbergia ruris]|uniref:Rolling Circle replication initiation protein N-terminal domain-containing protein n=1 Tax=Lederbergia ruris TaxID=217495 RepID=A0ABQ4KPR0_9BACI|nr:hypothetical protein J8TS2_42330 [Lederbergia ruris]